MVEWDEAKRRRNRQVHRVDFPDAARLDLRTAIVEPDLRQDYGEPRFVATGPIDGRLHVLVFTMRDGGMRVISLRKANRRERRRWDARTS